jgi:coproporphyrinogen III oxidase-like Fe-S oxidoreductase
MLSERLLTRVMQYQNAEQLKVGPFLEPRVPNPTKDSNYLLYVHVPFCERLCPYCSFNRYPFHEERTRSYFKALREELRMIADQGYDFESLYVGGGTPTVLLDELCATIDLANELFSIKEVSSETNPNHLLPAYAEELAPRVQRLSVGVQSFDDGLLKQMDRYDKYGSGQLTLERIQEMSGVFHSLNVDMIFNFPSQTEEMLRRDVQLLKESGCNQTTFYPLMASPAVSRSLAKTVGAVDYNRERTYYDIISEGLADTFEPASAWAFSRIAGGMIDEYIIDYEQYVGIGSGAFSFLEGGLYIETFSLRDYEAAIGNGRTGVTTMRHFGLKDQMRYRFLMELFGLRLDKKKFRADFGKDIDSALFAEMTFMRVNNAFERETADEVFLTQKGRYLLVAMMRQFFIGVNNVRDQARAALSAEERTLLFGSGEEDGAACAAPGCAPGDPLIQAEHETETAADVLPPVGPRG